VSARRKRHRGKHFNRTDQPRTQQTNNPANHGNSVTSEAAKNEPVRLGEVSLIASARLTEDAPGKSRKGPALQHLGLSHSRADELSASQSTKELSAPGAAFSRAPPARKSISWKALVVLFILSIPMAFVALVRMKDSPLSDFGDWRERTSASASLWMQGRTVHGGPGPRLAIHEIRGMSGEPLAIGTSMEGVVRDAVVIVRGLIPGMTLSTGSALGANAWRLPASEFAEVWIGPPKDFSGAVDITAELHLPDQSIADRRRFRLEWSALTAPAPEDGATPLEPAALASSADQAAPRLVDGSAKSLGRLQGADDPSSAPVDAAANLVPAPAGPSVMVQSPSVQPVPAQAAPALVVASAHPPTSAPSGASPLGPSAMPRTPQLDREQIAILVERGKHLIANGDLAAARVVLRRAAESKDAAAALALGSTYDPQVLRELKAFGFAPDLEMARGWYDKAKEFGSEEAQRRIQILARPGS
jgi:hypothetical protein